MTKPKLFIFPDVEVRHTNDYTEISTSVRVAKEDGSGYYFHKVTERDYLDKSANTTQQTLCRFNEMVYMAMLFGSVNEEMVNQHGESLFHMDESKETERERLKKIMLKKIGA